MKPIVEDRTCTAFAGVKKIADGEILNVAMKVKKHLLKNPNASILIFDDVTSNQIEIDFRGTADAVVGRLKDLSPSPASKVAGPGRPKLGIVSREISLLPRHWEWLALQPSGASATLRRLVDEAKKKNQGQDEIRQAQDATYKFMTVMAGDLPEFENALRAFYGKNKKLFEHLISIWPKDIQTHVQKLSESLF